MSCLSALQTLEHTFLRADESTRSREGLPKTLDSPMLVLFSRAYFCRPVYTCKHKAVTVKCRGACHEIHVHRDKSCAVALVDHVICSLAYGSLGIDYQCQFCDVK